MEGLVVTSTVANRSPVITGQEQRILEVYDRLEELQLEIALLRAQGVLSQGMFWKVVLLWSHILTTL